MNTDEFLAALAIAAVLGAAGSVAVAASRFHRETVRFQCLLFALAFALRFGLSLVIYNTSLGEALGDDDASGWYAGVLLESSWRMNGLGLLELPEAFLESFRGINRGYAYWLGVYFYLTGAPFRLVAAALNCACGALTVVLAYRTALALGVTVRGAARYGCWMALLPSLLLWSALTVKEPIVILLEVAALYGGVRLRAGGFALRHALLCAGAVALLTTLRFYAAYMVGVVVVASLALPRLGRRGVPLVSALFVAAVLGAVLGGMGASAEHEETIRNFTDLERVQSFRHGMAATANTGFGGDVSTNTSGGLLRAVSLGWVYLLLAPFPWQMSGGSVRLLLTMPEQLVWWGLFFTGVVPGFISLLRQRVGDALPLVLFVAGLGLVYSLTLTNVGTMYRERAQMVPYLVLFASLRYDRRRALRSAAAATNRRGAPTGPTVGARACWDAGPAPGRDAGPESRSPV